MRIETDAEDNNDENTPKPNFPVRDAINSTQINVLLSALGSLQPYLLLTQREFDAGTPKELDGGVPCAAVATFCNVCDRIDKLVKDDDRWKTAEIDALYASSIKTQESTIAVQKKQVAHLNELNRPSRALQPSFTQSANGLTVAFWGDPAVPGGLIVGKGNTPSEALLDFDAAFNRAASQQVKINAEGIRRLTGEVEPKAFEEEEPQCPIPSFWQRLKYLFRP